MRRWYISGLFGLAISGGVLASDLIPKPVSAVAPEPSSVSADLAELDPAFRSFLADLIELSGRAQPSSKEFAQVALQHREALKKMLNAEYETMFEGIHEGQLAQKLREIRLKLLNIKPVAQPKSMAEMAWNLWNRFKEEFLKFAFNALSEDRLKWGDFKVWDYQRAVHDFAEFKLSRLASTLSQEMDGYISDFRVSHSKEFREILDPVHGIQIQDANLDKVFREFIPTYYDKMNLERKRHLLVKILRADPAQGSAPRLAAFLQESGPLVQKLFQMVGRDAKSPVVKDAMLMLQSQVRPIDGAEAKQIAAHELGSRKFGDVFAEFDEKPVAAGTVGQVHEARLKNPDGSAGRKVMVKVLRPGIQEAFRKDYESIKRGLNPELHSISDIYYETAMHEGDLLHEARGLVVGAMAYDDPAKNTRVAGLAPEVRPTSNLIVIERARGATLGSEPNFANRARALQDLSRQLVQRVLFRMDAPSPEAVRQYRERYESVFGKAEFEKMIQDVQGFFHADPHGGNVFIQGDSKTWIDFGHVDSLSEKQRRGLLRLILATGLDHSGRKDRGLGHEVPERVIAAMELISGKVIDPKIRYLFRGEVSRILSDKKLGEMSRIGAITQAAVRMGIPLPKAYLSLDRAFKMLSGELRDANREMAKTGTEGMEFDEIFREEFTGEVKRALNPIRLVGGGANSLFGPQELIDAAEIGTKSFGKPTPAGARKPASGLDACVKTFLGGLFK